MGKGLRPIRKPPDPFQRLIWIVKNVGEAFVAELEAIKARGEALGEISADMGQQHAVFAQLMGEWSNGLDKGLVDVKDQLQRLIKGLNRVGVSFKQGPFFEAHLEEKDPIQQLFGPKTKARAKRLQGIINGLAKEAHDQVHNQETAVDLKSPRERWTYKRPKTILSFRANVASFVIL
ncbi:hypothetical protein L2V44_14090 [Staphylococcus aureus]|nr:hypothetical protein [Staphylococcus aureus]